MARPPTSVRRSAALFFAATVVGHVSQFAWLIAGSRVLSPDEFGAVLAAQVLYATLQIAVDNGTAAVGARRAAQGDLAVGEIAQLVRIRLLLAAAVAPIAIGVGLAGGTLNATLPFVLALVGFALLNVWAPYGAGNPRPWAAYMVARSAVPAAVAVVYLVVDSSFPVFVPGALECLVLVGVAGLSRQHPLEALRRALAARGGPWRSTMSIGVPAVFQQVSVAAGTIGLSVSGRAAAAGALAASIRMLTGLTAVNGILATAMFPSLASRGGLAHGTRTVTVALAAVIGFTLVVCAICCVAARQICELVIGRTDDGIEGALILVTTASPAMAAIVMLTYLLVAAHHERAALAAFGAGATVSVVGSAASVAAGAGVEILAAVILMGQVVTAIGLSRLTYRLVAGYGRVATVASSASAASAAIAVVAVGLGSRPAAAALMLALAAALIWGVRRDVLTTVGKGLSSRRVTVSGQQGDLIP